MTLILTRLNNLYENRLAQLSKMSVVKLIFLTVVIEIIVALVFSFLLFPDHTAGPKFENRTEEFFTAVFFAPLIETLIFQYALISYILSKWSNAFLLSCIVTAILFGLSHIYSPEYILKTFLSGLLFGTLYLVAFKKKTNAFIVVAVAHSIYNFIVFCLRNI